jgi:hypothetical protein
VIPRRALQSQTRIETAGHSADLIADCQPDSAGGWVVELIPEDTSEFGSRAIKLIDARTNLAIGNAPVRLDFHQLDGMRDSRTMRTSALGYVFVPFGIVAGAAEDMWVVVPGYRRTRLDFAWQRRKTRLIPMGW